MTLTTGGNLGLLIHGAQGDLHYNELMARWRGIDGLCQPVAKTTDSLTPPGSPANGDVHIVARGDTQLDLAWSRSGSTITLTWEAHGLTVGRPFRVTASSSTGAVSLADFTVLSVTDANTITFTGTAGGDTTGTLEVFQLPYGTWAGHVDKIARYYSTGATWEYYTPKKGWQIGAADRDTPMFYGGTVTGWRGTLSTLEANTRGRVILDLTGLSTYTLLKTEAVFCVVYVIGDRNCTITYPTEFDTIVPSFVFISAEFYGYTLSVHQQSSGNTYQIKSATSTFFAYGEGDGMGDVFAGAVTEARAQTRGTFTHTGSYTLTANDPGCTLTMNNSSAATVTVDANVGFLSDAILRVHRIGAGTVTVAGTNGATISGTTSVAAGHCATLYRDGSTNTWYCG